MLHVITRYAVAFVFIFIAPYVSAISQITKQNVPFYTFESGIAKVRSYVHPGVHSSYGIQQNLELGKNQFTVSLPQLSGTYTDNTKPYIVSPVNLNGMQWMGTQEIQLQTSFSDESGGPYPALDWSIKDGGTYSMFGNASLKHRIGSQPVAHVSINNIPQSITYNKDMGDTVTVKFTTRYLMFIYPSSSHDNNGIDVDVELKYRRLPFTADLRLENDVVELQCETGKECSGKTAIFSSHSYQSIGSVYGTFSVNPPQGVKTWICDTSTCDENGKSGIFEDNMYSIKYEITEQSLGRQSYSVPITWELD
ncbi:hypothetical protein D3G64_27390 [Escherichia coli]|nr:hypothetical protein [Escherichia coli]